MVYKENMKMNFIKRWLVKRELDKKQNEINEEYAKNGLTDEILKKQVELNTLRNKYNISDKSNVVNDEGFVQ